jgi:hypothetical protein
VAFFSHLHAYSVSLSQEDPLTVSIAIVDKALSFELDSLQTPFLKEDHQVLLLRTMLANL